MATASESESESIVARTGINHMPKIVRENWSSCASVPISNTILQLLLLLLLLFALLLFIGSPADAEMKTTRAKQTPRGQNMRQ